LKVPNRFSKNPKISNFMKIRSVGADLLHADKETERRECMRKLMVAFRNFANAPRNHKRTDHLQHLSKVRTGLRVIAYDGTK
jgi:plasmid stabilization system protein ParE